MRNMPAAYITKHPMMSEGLSKEEMGHRAMLVALGLVYFMRLDSKYRIKFAEKLDTMHNFAVNFQTAFTQEVLLYNSDLGYSSLFL